MEERFCPECGHVKEEWTLPFCHACYKQFRLEINQVKELLKKQPTLSVMDIARETGLSVRRLKQMLEFGSFQRPDY
ncbi:hypothetical protein [Halalkalibacter oceani]|uniref:Uncharacterized protein n=1 Tax=Halalkalibacter oceani TaxID=1653776 RepID=A0A9X2IPP8_9BACI|nr:hypothetical protein [Halalkalibacter oceani]MCM3714652.1 hypothetical protein [Halalkalibacter oceani]